MAESLLQRLRHARRQSGQRGWRVSMQEKELQSLCEAARELLLADPNLIELQPGISIVGDIHGQFSDLQRLLCMHGSPSPSQPYLFLGDYVDRGRNGLEVFVFLLALKVLHPRHIFLLRGNHECSAVSRVYGFYDEVCLLPTFSIHPPSFHAS